MRNCWKMVRPILYTVHQSPPCRSVELAAKALGLDLEQKVVNLLKGEHLTPEYLKMNPQHTVPVLDDGGTIVCESHAIMIYLVAKYGKDDSLYPKELAKQSKVNAALFFETAVLFARTRLVFESILFLGFSEISEEKINYVNMGYQLLEDTLVDDYVVGNSMTLADFSCVSSVSSISGVVPMDEDKYPKVHAWMNRMKALPYYEEANGSGAEAVAQLVLATKENNAAKL